MSETEGVKMRLFRNAAKTKPVDCEKCKYWIFEYTATPFVARCCRCGQEIEGVL